MFRAFFALVLTLSALPAAAEDFYVYVGDVNSNSAIIAWGKTSGSSNSIGRDSTPYGSAVVQIAGREIAAEKNWVQVRDLQPDHEYPYQVKLKGVLIGQGSVRTFPLSANRLSFFVIGDYGDAGDDQKKLAQVMRREFLRRAQTDNPIRFVLTVGDNLYGWGLWPVLLGTGEKDSHWDSRFFGPYRDILRYAPFYPTIGSHDGGDEESDKDLDVYLDNFFFPGGRPARYYQFSFANLADFFALDTTENETDSSPAPGVGPSSEQFRWMQSVIPASKAKWKIAYFHHPPFTAGPEHLPSLPMLRHWVDLFKRNGVNVVFSGHENNFQWADTNEETGKVQYVVSGSGGKLRDGELSTVAEAAGIKAWASQHEFLLVQIENDRMEVTPISTEQIKLETADGESLHLPLTVQQ